MGILTADVTPLGVVMTGDSQPVELRESSYSVLPPAGQRQRQCLVAGGGSDFKAALGFVGTEWIGEQTTFVWLREFVSANPNLSLDDFCTSLAAALTDEWTQNSYETVLWIFVCGASGEVPVFRAIRNCGDIMDENLLYTEVGPTFKWVDDLANHIEQHGPLTQASALYRNGVLLPAAGIHDRFSKMLEQLVAGGFRGFEPVSSLGAYAAIVKMRAEFVKRMFDQEKGVYKAEDRPIGGVVFVWRVELDGSIYNHTGKKPEQVEVVA
jgi:hypothetical protein